MASDFSLGLGSPESFIAALDQDSPHYDRRNDASMRELFLTSQPYADQHDIRLKSLQSGDTRLNNQGQNRPLPQIITENLNNSAVDTSMLMTSNLGYEPHSATTNSSYGGSPKGEDDERWPEERKSSQTLSAPRPRKNRREKPRIELAPDQPPTTQGKARARVYVACVQWWVHRHLVCATATDSPTQVVLAKFVATARSQLATTAVVERLGPVVHAHMTHNPSVVARIKRLAHVNEPPEMQVRMQKPM